ncbi:von Willebrand factor A domain-containing protein 5A-like [Paramisgurnus dabryanus]|uniref:von Willebrand factor A domain-containing protein 5A-like n=1 Tax=Paramisgurnus dabryanus TaxID=90735 RepID=UPI0031F3DFA3
MDCCGLVTKRKLPVPLKSIRVEVQVKSHVATVTSTLQYVNEEERHLEALFVFPLPADAAVCHFSAKIGDQEIVAEVQERQTARDEYDDAVSSGRRAFLLEESEESSDVFSLSVGCLSPGQNADITITYITELSVQADHSLRFGLPAVLNPRYTPAGSDAGIVSEISSCVSVPYTLTLSVHVSSPNPISKLESNCTLDPLVFLNSDHTQATVNLSSGHKFDKDVELFLFYQNTHQPTAIVEAGVTAGRPDSQEQALDEVRHIDVKLKKRPRRRGRRLLFSRRKRKAVSGSSQASSLMSDPVVMVSLYPEFPKEVMSSLPNKGEFIFVMDRSGSMNCLMHNGKGAKTRIQSAKATLILLLKSLPMGCYFNIYGFGYRFDCFSTFNSVKYNQDTMDQALQAINRMEADLCSTDIVPALQHIYSQPCYPEHPRQLFVFTDGEVRNTKEVLDLVRDHAQSHRCFSFGIGEGASTALVTGMAREGSGHAQFITGTDRMQPKVMESLRFALQPVLNKISVKWKVPDGIKVITLSPPVKMLFQGQRSLIYAQLKGQSSESSEGSVIVQYNLKDQPVTNQLHFCLKPTEDTGLSIHRLSARSLIRCLEQRERKRGGRVANIRRRMVEISVETGVSSVHTAFIAINKHNREAVKGPLIQRRVPIQVMRHETFFRPVMCGGGAPPPYSHETAIAEAKEIDDFGVELEEKPHSLQRKRKADSASSQSKPKPQMGSSLQLITLQKASGCWELNAALARVFGKTENELTNQKPAQVDGLVWATLLSLIWLYGYKIQQQIEWQFVAMKAASWIGSQNVVSLSQCVCDGNHLLGCQVKEETLGI